MFVLLTLIKSIPTNGFIEQEIFGASIKQTEAVLTNG